MKILAIETSCDETAASVLEAKGGRFSILSNIIASQIKIHAKTGGVVPEVAAREHVEKIIPIVKKAIKGKVDLIAVTAGPGLATSLSVGVETAKALAYIWKKPIVAVNHLAGHVYANWLDNRKIEFPILCLIVSGGHTELVLMKKHLDFKIIGSTRDDAAGEAFDKVAKILKLGYPGGPEIAKRVKGKDKIKFPRPMIKSNDFDFSFSGLKTAVLYYHKDHKKQINEICTAFQNAVIDVLVTKTKKAARKYKVKTVLLGGGVAANQALRNKIKQELNCNPPQMKYTTDNAAMIAAAGYFMAKQKQFTPWQKLDIDPNWELGQKFKPLPR